MRPQRLKVLIVGAGVAGLEAALALRELAGDLVAITLLAPGPEFVYRPLRVLEPFAHPAARHYPLDELAADLGVRFKPDAFRWLEAERRLVHTEAGDTIGYDVLLLAPGATRRARLMHALTLDDAHLDEQLHGLNEDVAAGSAHKLAFVIPAPMPWPLPIYELALMTARRARDMDEDISVTLVTAEDAPLAIFGAEASSAVRTLLEAHGILVITAARCEIPAPGIVAIHPGERRLHVDRIVALAELAGPHTPGVPRAHPTGFIPVDAHGRVRGLQRVYAAGDATDFAVKHGGIAAQQADVAAEAIAALAGAPIEPREFDPLVQAVLHGGDEPMHLSARITGSQASATETGDAPTWTPPSMLTAKYLTPFLQSRPAAAVSSEAAHS